VTGANLPLSCTYERLPVTQHPTLHLVDARCSSCGASFSTRSTAHTISVEVCSNCHPAYTGREHAVASGSRIERFNRRRTFAAAA
jgi:large subunit ribosomal protein L31